MRRLLLVALLATAVSAAPALAGPTEDFRKLQDDYWQTYLKDNPTFAQLNGVSSYDTQLERGDRPEIDRQVAEAKAFLTRLDAINPNSLPTNEQTNYAILKNQLSNFVASAYFGSNFIPYSSGGTQADGLAQYLNFIPLKSATDYDHFLTKLGLVGDRLRSANAIALASAKAGYARPCSTLAPLDKSTAAPVDPDPTKSSFYEQFAKPAPAGIDAAQWATFQQRARTIIAGEITPAITAFNKEYTSELRPRCLKSDGMSALPDGKANYAFLVKYHTTTDMTPDQIHALGLSEVARIRSEMDALAKKSGFPSREAMIADMRTNPKYFAKTPEELMEKASRLAKTIDGKMPTLFGKLPRLPYGLKEIPAATAEGQTTAYYVQGSPEGGISGTYFVNTSKLNQRPLWELPALTAHEAVPGHHNQIALQQEMDTPAWRRNLAFYTAFVEGWGLYAERLGIDMGLYDTPQKDMGRLSYEMWRASRLVVDTGIHAKGWTKAQAVAFMKDNTALTDANIDAEVNRYISTPGQALAYKIGELRMRALRSEAEKTLGDKFDIRAFHDALLTEGPVPIDELERRMKAWIAAQKAKA